MNTRRRPTPRRLKARGARAVKSRSNDRTPVVAVLGAIAVVGIAICCGVAPSPTDEPATRTKRGPAVVQTAAPVVAVTQPAVAKPDRASDDPKQRPAAEAAAVAPPAKATQVALVDAAPAPAPVARASWVSLDSPGERVSRPAGYVWWEAEDARSHTFPSSNAFQVRTSQEKSKLSGGTWLQTGKGSGVTASYEIDVPSAGAYHFWVRKFWKHGPFEWRFGAGEWKTCSRRCALADAVEIRKHLCANWVSLGKVTLPRGRATFELKALSEATAIAFDCFVLSKNTFAPNGKKKPGEKYAPRVEGWFAFEPDHDTFASSPIDLRGLNEPEAGSKGFIRARGADFVHERDGTPVRFWAVNMASESIMLERGSVDYLARKLAKLGVNMIRFHGPIYDKKSDDPTKIDEARLDGLFYMITAMKKVGIYTKVSFYYPRWFPVKPTYGLPGYDEIENKNPYGLIFFHPRMQQIYKAWARTLMTTRNPYTGIALKDDPAVAIVEVVNEDNYFFWTFNPGKVIPAECMVVLEREFASWLRKKYGSLAKLDSAWGENPATDDGRVPVMMIWSLTGQAKGKRNERRARDQAQFLTEHQRAYHEKTVRFYREELGARCLISASNWTTADNRTLLAMDKYTNMATDVMDRHGYHDGGDNTKGGEYRDVSALFRPDRMPLTEIQFGEKPHIMSEVNWHPPQRFRAELVPLLAAYGALQGNDSQQLFCVGSSDWLKTEATKKCTVYIPVIMGQFPAAAMLYRRGYVKEGPIVAHSRLELAKLYQLEGTPLRAEVSTDEWITRHAGKAKATTEKPGPIDTLAGFVGQIRVDVSERGGNSEYRNLSKYIDRSRKKVTSATDELSWDYGAGLVTIDTPTAQGATGFLAKAGAIRLGDVTMRLDVEYGSVLLVSLDGKPVSASSSLMLQVMTEQRNHGWKTTGGDKKKIVSLGGPPIMVRECTGTVSLTRGDAARLKVTALDLNGYGAARLDGGAASIPLRPNCLYYAIER